MQHADDGYSRHVNLGGAHVHDMVLMCLPDGINVYGSRMGNMRGRVSVGLKVVKWCF